MRMKIGLATLTLILAGVQAHAAESTGARLEYLFEETVTLLPDEKVGATVLGERAFVGITGGKVEGKDLKARVLPGGWDWQQVGADGCLRIKADYFWRTDDGALIKVMNRGSACPPVNGVASPVYTFPEFETPRGRYDWLTRAPLVGILDRSRGGAGEPAVHIRFYRLVPQ